MSGRLHAPIALLIAAFATSALAQKATSPEPEPATARRPLSLWTQAEREDRFAHWDTYVRKSRTVARGTRVQPLPAGAPLPAFLPGGEGAMQLDQYAADFKLAGIVVLRDGKVRLERYALGHSAAGRWTSFSVAKSLTSTLVGAAIKDGYIGSVEDPVTRYIPDLRGSAYDGVTVRQLLTMTSGVKWNEDYTDVNADVARFYSTLPEPGMDATVSYMRKLPREAPPGQKWLYKTGETNLLGVLVSQATNKDLATYASEKIWAPVGMEQDAAWQLDRTDHAQGGCCLHAATRDYARLGQFVLDGARIDGKSIVPDGWFNAATRKQADIGRPGRGYGYQWWTSDDGSFDAIGIHGQMIHIDPARRLVVVINSAWPVATGQALSAARFALLKVIAAAVDTEGRSGDTIKP